MNVLKEVDVPGLKMAVMIVGRHALVLREFMIAMSVLLVDRLKKSIKYFYQLSTELWDLNYYFDLK